MANQTPSNSVVTDLLPCPFCGGPAVATPDTDRVAVLEDIRRRGQDEGFAAAVQQLRDMGAVKPTPSHAAIAALLADSLERSRIPCAALSQPLGSQTEGS